MSDDSPWKPPAPGRSGTQSVPDDPPVMPSSDPEPSEQPSPWARESADGTFEPNAPRSEPATVPEPVLPDPATVPEPVLPDPATVPEPVLPEPDPGSPNGGPVHVAPPSAFGPPGPDAVVAAPDTATPDELAAGGEPPARRAGKVVAVAVAVILAVGLAGIFAVRGLTGETASGGATPEELGEELLDAIEGEDVLGVIDLLLPGERRTLGEPLIDTVSELERLDVLAAELDLAEIAGIDVSLAERSVSVESTNVADIAHVHLAADLTVTLDGAEAPIGPLITDNLPDEMLTELRGTRLTETDSFDVELTAVEREGRWYFSAWYTAAEEVRNASGIPEIPVDGVGAVGAESPEAAIDRFLGQVAELDVRGMIQSLDPYEAEALQRYAPLFLPDVEAATAEFTGQIRVVDTSFRYDGSGSSRTAFVDSFAVEIDDEGVLARFGYADGCTRIEWSNAAMGDDSMEFCQDDVDVAEEIAGITVPAEMEALGQTLTEAFADIEPIGIELRERDDGWFLSPVGTVSEAWLGVLRALDRDELDAIVETAPPAVEAFMNEVLSADGGTGMLDEAFGDLPGDVVMPDEELVGGPGDGAAGTVTLDDVGTDVGTDGGIDGDGGAPGSDPIADCYEIVDTAEAMTCFDEIVAAGDAEPWVVPTVFRFPECGLADIMWTGDIYTASDDEFVAAITEAQRCFADLVADGTIGEWELPYEVSEFDCFENRNWYATFDDAEYDDRVLACLELE